MANFDEICYTDRLQLRFKRKVLFIPKFCSLGRITWAKPRDITIILYELNKAGKIRRIASPHLQTKMFNLNFMFFFAA